MSEYSQWDIERIEQAAYRSGVNNAGREWAREVSTLQARIAELEAENERMKEERRWIPVSERLPEDLQSVVIITNDSMTGIVRYLELYGREGFGAWSEDVTHWMPLPESPIMYGKVCEE
jgi:hypothetical protein